MDFSVKKSTESSYFTSYWRIENFNLKPDTHFSIDSPFFEIQELKSKWYLEIAEKDGYLGVFLFKAAEPKFCLTKFCISFLTSKEWSPALEKPSYRYKGNFSGYGVFKVASLEKLKLEPWVYLPNGSLTISLCVKNNKLESECSQCLMISRVVNENEVLHRPIEYFSDLKPDDLLSYPPTYKFNSNKVPMAFGIQKEVKSQIIQTDSNADFKDGDDLLKNLKDKEYSFVTLRTPNKEFVVLKAVLCANSPVFSAMFETQMKENDCKLVEIEDIDSQTMGSFVRFLHFQPMENLNWDAAVTLYYAAHKYQIDSLKKECMVFLEQGLSVENVCDAFLLADLHQDKDLMNCAQEYFSKNLKSVFTSKQWKDFLCHSELVAEILYQLGENM